MGQFNLWDTEQILPIIGWFVTAGEVAGVRVATFVCKGMVRHFCQNLLWRVWHFVLVVLSNRFHDCGATTQPSSSHSRSSANSSSQPQPQPNSSSRRLHRRRD